MEAENDEATKRHDDNAFSLHSILLIVQVSAALAVAGYFGFEGFIVWFDWFRLVLRNIFFIFIILNALIASIYFTFHIATERKKPSLHDEYITPVRSSFAPMEVGDYVGGGGGGGYCNNSSYNQESVNPFQEVNTVEESSSCCYERVVMERSSKSCTRMMMSSEKKKKKTRSSTVEYRHQRTESERVMKTASSSSCRSWQAMMDELSGEEFRTKVESFIMEKKIYGWRDDDGVSQLHQNGVADQCHQNGVAYQWHNRHPQLQNGVAQHWPNGYPQSQNGGFEQWQNRVPQLQGQPDYDGTGSHGPCLAISN